MLFSEFYCQIQNSRVVCHEQEDKTAERTYTPTVRDIRSVRHKQVSSWTFPIIPPWMAVVDPEFPLGGAPTSYEGGANG